MRKAIFSLLAVMVIAIGATAMWGPIAQAKYTYLFQASDGNDANSQ
jgi:hypothetical protein